jgi:hypothetical protein
MNMTPSEQITLLKSSSFYNASSQDDVRNLMNHLLDVARKCDSPLHEQAALVIQSLSQKKY